MNLAIDDQAARHLIAGLQFLKLRHDLRPADPHTKQEIALIYDTILQGTHRPVMQDHEIDGLIKRIEFMLPPLPPVP